MDSKDDITIQEIFQKHIKIEPKVMAIQTMFNNPRRLQKTNYKPPYQRNYVWDNEKATYFIESIILGTEIPPLIFFKSGENIEVIDGRQRYETIFNFVRENSKQKLTQKGLLIFNDLNNKKFEDLDIEIRNVFWETKLRLIEFGFITDNHNKEIEEIVKREIFKRYNSGITPLKSTEIDKAKYLDNNLTSYFKSKFQKDKKVYDVIKTLFHYDTINLEILLKEIRKILVIDKIPISYYSTKKDIVLNKFYEFYFDQENLDCEQVYFNFIQKINLLFTISRLLKKTSVNRLVFECLYWAITIVEEEGVSLEAISNSILEQNGQALVSYLESNMQHFAIDRNSFSPQIMKRYITIADFFTDKFNIDFTKNLKNNDAFKSKNSSIDKKDKTDKSTLEKFESLRLNKPDASSITIDDICLQMENARFLIRPPYQRDEVINKIKSSAIIESIILGIKLPPIFIYKRKDGVSEVIDGQQRLLSIIGFIGKKYVNEHGKLTESNKNNFPLALKNGILSDLDKKTYKNLASDIQNKILDFDLWVIEINEKNNPDFEQVDLYLRLNSKPFPIKENTFEMWNSFMNKNIIDGIKSIYEDNKDWFYLRKNNTRMDNEDLVTSLIYLFFKVQGVQRDFDKINSFLDTYLSAEKINVRIKAKNEITSILEKNEFRDKVLKEIREFKHKFLDVILALINVNRNESNLLSDELDKLLNSDTKRTSKNFYILWLLIANVEPELLFVNKDIVKQEISSIIASTNKIESRDTFKQGILNFWRKYNEKNL
ncbi:DUF262 domain-containing protein [Mucilaginibacter sp. SMC90]|uniref:DUF262 domain-containing protein n=1 Tax=Mucilaginibacter sp. SMC90 TaxID=2929803 RepID=UPI001FB54766|nr:DUF262 domain-containing protein [Mucilaginibacter sp. SMC90]UOE47856.1 DUF262 domain-containing protein [Mucilaginibacter sp. SMC90]